MQELPRIEQLHIVLVAVTHETMVRPSGYGDRSSWDEMRMCRRQSVQFSARRFTAILVKCRGRPDAAACRRPPTLYSCRQRFNSKKVEFGRMTRPSRDIDQSLAVSTAWAVSRTVFAMPPLHFRVRTALTTQPRCLARSLQNPAACPARDPLPVGFRIPRDTKAWMGVKAVPAAFAGDDLNPQGMEQGLVHTLVVTALIKPGEP